MLKLNTLIDPWLAAEQNLVISGIFDLSQLPRLLGLVAAPVGQAQCRLEFFCDAKQQHHCVKGRVWGKIQMVCQRCLGSVEMLLETEVLLALVTGYDETMQLPDAYEPFIVIENKIIPLDIAEDEILLALPNFPIHEKTDDCLVNDQFIMATLQKNSVDDVEHLQHSFQGLNKKLIK